MKVFAIESRGAKKDFFDMYCLLDRYSMDEIMTLTLKKFPTTNPLHVVRSLTDFHDAEDQINPDMLIPISWDQVKERLITEVRRIVL